MPDTINLMGKKILPKEEIFDIQYIESFPFIIYHLSNEEYKYIIVIHSRLETMFVRWRCLFQIIPELIVVMPRDVLL
jgi:hypothetical protein